jgi:hypothetical protein
MPAAQLVEARAILVPEPFGATKVYQAGVDTLTELGVIARRQFIPWGTASSIERIIEPLNEAIDAEVATPRNQGPLVLIGPGISASLVGLTSLRNSQVDGAILISPPEVTNSKGQLTTAKQIYPLVKGAFEEELRAASATQRRRLTLMTHERTLFLSGAAHDVFSPDSIDGTPTIHDDINHFFNTEGGIQTLVSNVVRFRYR